ncbi:MAG: glycosyltransferase [Bacteroidales bacterium]|nr:glycosyltransferase [Bacteroidales bacterium]
MKILINASNLKIGGGLQVADSFCKNLINFPSHSFFAVLSSSLSKTGKAIEKYPNIEVFSYDIKNNISTLLFGRDKFLDCLVREKKADCVLTIFGPSRWNPKINHLSGFAMGQLVLKDSPFFSKLSIKDKIYWKFFFNLSRKYLFKRSTSLFYSENKYISECAEKILKGSKCYTVTNYYNQIYDNPSLWKDKTLKDFDGISLLCISSYYPFKNLEISIGASRILKERHKDFSFRFIFTCCEDDFPPMDENIRNHFVFLGRVDLEECPSLYRQCDLVFMPSLMECFTAVYPEAMKMQRPLITSDLPFARSLCGKAAEYFSPLSEEDLAEKIFSLAQNNQRQKELISQGKEQLKQYDNYNQRSQKIIDILEKEFS